MSNLASALGKKFQENKDLVRIRTFELGGHTFKVKVPLTVESDAIYLKLKNLDEEKIEQYYQQLTEDLVKNKLDIPEDAGIEYTENDVLVQGRSMREAATNKFLTEMRITEMFKLLVPEEKGFDMSSITYSEIEELFPLPIQMAIVEEIGNVISFDYGKTKEK